MNRQTESKQFLALPESKKYPRIFRLKTASLVVLILIFIAGIVDLFFLIYLRNNPQPSTNISFINDVAVQSNSLGTGDELNLVSGNLLAAYPKFYYQYAHKLIQGTGAQLTANVMKDEIFSKYSNNIMFLLRVRPEGASETRALVIFSSSYFLIPKDQYNSTLDYYTFSSSSEGQSIVFSLSTYDYLVMNPTPDPEDILKCKTYIFSQKTSIFSFFGIFTKNFKSDILSLIPQAYYKCFSGVSNQAELIKKIRALTGMTDQSVQVSIENYQVYQLTNKK